MNNHWLVNKLFIGRGHPDPFFAFLGSANWMRALAIKSASLISNPTLAKQFYNEKIKSECSPDASVSCVESHYKGLHYLAAVKSIASSKEKTYDLIRPAIISWYYVLYFASKAFLWAKCGEVPNNHSATAKQLQYHVILKDLFIEPFSINVPTVVEKEFEEHVSKNYPCDRFELKDEPVTSCDAQSAMVAYLRGTAKYMREKVEEETRRTKDFKALGVSDFRKKKARELRDQFFRKKPVNILVQAFRYRGKANYRDGLYLSYGKNNLAIMRRWSDDMHSVAKAFMVMVTAYLMRRVPSNLWNEYRTDITANTQFNLDDEVLNPISR